MSAACLVLARRALAGLGVVVAVPVAACTWTVDTDG